MCLCARMCDCLCVCVCGGGIFHPLSPITLINREAIDTHRVVRGRFKPHRRSLFAVDGDGLQSVAAVPLSFS